MNAPPDVTAAARIGGDRKVPQQNVTSAATQTVYTDRPYAVIIAWPVGRAMNRITSSIWVFTYDLELARERFAARRQLLRQAGACLILSLLRLVGGHHV